MNSRSIQEKNWEVLYLLTHEAFTKELGIRGVNRVPNIGEQITWDKTRYEVCNVVYDYDTFTITVFARLA